MENNEGLTDMVFFIGLWGTANFVKMFGRTMHCLCELPWARD
jgi:hypothetical protein